MKFIISSVNFKNYFVNLLNEIYIMCLSNFDVVEIQQNS